MRVLSFDPGGNTGVAIWEVTDNEYKRIACASLSIEDFYKYTERWIETVDLVIYEDFKLFPKSAQRLIGNDFISSQLIGIIKFLCFKYNKETYKNLSSIKTFWHNDLLKHLNLYDTISHKRDATRHFLQWWYIDTGKGNKKDLLY